MRACTRCNKEVMVTINGICKDCYDILQDEEDFVDPHELATDFNKVKGLSPRQMVRNFVKIFVEYQKNPSADLCFAMCRIFSWACHEDHTVSTTISEIWKWQGFNRLKEMERWKGGENNESNS